MRCASRRLRFASLGLLALASCTGFRSVRPDVYRTRQPGEDQQARVVLQFGIRTVVCLRGEGEASAQSARASAGAGASFVQIPMSANHLPQPATLLALWRVAAAAERPLLVHCRAGVDRTGLACALVVLHDTGDLSAARAELGLVPHGHLPIGSTAAMDEVLDRYAPWHGRLSFPDWVAQVYAQDPAFAAAPAAAASR